VCVEDLAQERAQLRRFRFREGCREFCLHGVGRGLQFVEVSLAERGDGDGVAASICDVGRADDVPGIVESGHDPVDGVAVQSELPAEVGLAVGPYSSSAARTAKSARPVAGIRVPVSREPSTFTRFACQLSSARNRAGGAVDSFSVTS